MVWFPMLGKIFSRGSDAVLMAGRPNQKQVDTIINDPRFKAFEDTLPGYQRLHVINKVVRIKLTIYYDQKCKKCDLGIIYSNIFEKNPKCILCSEYVEKFK